MASTNQHSSAAVDADITNPSVAFFKEYFAHITVQDCLDLVQKQLLPTILPPNTTKNMAFGPQVPTDPSQIYVLPGEAVLGPGDLHLITKNMQDGFRDDGHRCVYVQHCGVETLFVYHFAKVSSQPSGSMA